MQLPGPSLIRRRLAIALLVGSLLLVSLLASPRASAAGPFYISGTISGNRVWTTGDIWVMYGNVTILPAATLTIQPGVTVKADPGVRLYVRDRGTLNVGGAAGNLITFAPNKTAVTAAPWGGIQFNASSSGFVSWASFSRVERAIHAIQSSPTISNNVIDTAFFGIQLEASSAFVSGNRINYTNIGIQASTSGDVTLFGNTLTNMTGNPALAIYATNLQSVSIQSSIIRDLVASNGRTLATAGSRGTDGGYAVGILVNATSTATITGNTITKLVGGRAGNGAANTTGNGGRGGDGGSAAGIVSFGLASADVSFNTISGVTGGRGGNGGASSAPTGNGGNGGNGGIAAGVETLSSVTSAVWSGNTVAIVTGGPAGDGGASAPSGSMGNGGLGGDVHGFLTGQAMDGDAFWNTVQVLRGGYGGNSTGLRGTSGGSGGQAAAFWSFGVDGSGSIHDNTFTDLIGGAGGGGRLSAGAGGNSTGVLAVGDGKPFNLTVLQANTVSALTGGTGGLGTPIGGTGGTVTGIAAFHVQLDSSWNTITSLTGGKGADAVPGNFAGRGGDSTAFIAALLPAGASESDTILTVTKGAAGTGPSSAKSYGVGIYAIGNATTRTRLTVTNGTLSGIGDLEIHVDNYTEAVAVNTPFSLTKFAVEKAGNLTVRNFLDVNVYWPNNSTLLGGASVRVDDDGVPIRNAVTSTGQVQWLVVTDRVYIQSTTTIHDNATKITVSYSSSSFWTNPRSVDMGTSHGEDFGMIDAAAPTSSASTLPTYENSRTFNVLYTYSDGNGVGVKTVSLWYRSGSGAWTNYGVQSVPTAGDSFTFTAASDGAYQFYTTATDNAGNSQPAPVGDTLNNTWTIVDTARPGSRVNVLASYENTLSFAASWSPDPGVTDILAYTIQYNSGSGWIDWLEDTHATSGTFTAGSEGAYAFRSIARDRAGNVETTPAGNDTWTIVDVTRPTATKPVPIGGNVSVSPVITITFSEPMNRTSVEKAFSVGVGVNGTFVWSADSREVSFVLSKPLQAGTTYTVVVTTSAKDLAGNQMLTPLTYQFSTVSPAPTGLALSDFWWLLPIVAAVVGGALILIMRRRTATAPKPVAPAAAPKTKEAIIEDLFLLNHRDGILIKHETRRLRPDVDTDILTGMLTAVQQFVKDALRGDDYADLNEMTVGHMHILIGRGKWLVLAARIEGDGSEPWTAQIERCIKDMEDHHWDQLEDWDGDMTLARVLTPYMKKLIAGEYAQPHP